jgi:CheY-like chemotaxis protein
MPVIHVLDDDAQTRGALAAQLGRLFPHARVIAGTPAELARVVLRAASRRGAGAPPAEARLHIEDGSIVLTDLAGAERIAGLPRRPALRVVALTPEMGPATLMRAEAAGVYATLRAPATAEGLRAVLEPIVGDGRLSGTEG